MHEQLDRWAVVAITCAVYWDADTALLHGQSLCELVVLCWGCVDGSEVSVVAAWLLSVDGRGRGCGRVHEQPRSLGWRAVCLDADTQRSRTDRLPASSERTDARLVHWQSAV